MNSLKKENQKLQTLGEKEISKGTLGYVKRFSNKTVFEFFKSNIDKRKKLKEEMNDIIKSFKENKIKEGILNIKSINNNNIYTIITEPVIDSISNLHYTTFKGFEIYKMLQKFNVFLKYCFDNKINLSNLDLSGIYLTRDYEIKIFSLKYDTEIIHKIKKEKFSTSHNNNQNNMLYLIGTIIYYLFYNQYPNKKETKFPEQKHLKELLKYCLNLSKKFDYDEYINHTFFHPDIIFPEISEENILLFNKYIEYVPSKESIMSPDCEELYYNSKEESYKQFFTIYNSFDKSKVLEEIESRVKPELYKLRTEKNKNLYVIQFSDDIFILKKYNNKYSLIQDKLECYNFIELSSGDLAVIDNKFHVNIYSKNSENKFDKKFILSDFKAEKLFETNDNHLSVDSDEGTALYDVKNFKLKKSKDCGIYLNEKILINGDKIYHEFFEEYIYEIGDSIYSILKKKDGTYLLGGKKNHIFQLKFDKYGFVELLSEVDTGYGYYEDDLSGDCIYSYSASRYYSVGYIEECENGDILTISDFCKIKKFWKFKI